MFHTLWLGGTVFDRGRVDRSAHRLHGSLVEHPRVALLGVHLMDGSPTPDTFTGWTVPNPQSPDTITGTAQCGRTNSGMISTGQVDLSKLYVDVVDLDLIFVAQSDRSMDLSPAGCRRRADAVGSAAPLRGMDKSPVKASLVAVLADRMHLQNLSTIATAGSGTGGELDLRSVCLADWERCMQGALKYNALAPLRTTTMT